MTDATLRDEALQLIAQSRELLSELLDEGVDAVVPADYAPTSVEGASPSPASLAASAAPTHSTASQPPPAVTRPERAPTRLRGPVDVASPQPVWSASPSLEEVRDALGECTRCALCERRKSIVFGSGNPNADLMFIGEGPGEQEDLQGMPFVGRAGELLTSMIEKGIEIPRSDVYICNIVKCRPPGNRNPLPQEVASCRPFLDGQIAAVQPKVIVSLGKPAASLLLGREVAITRERGQWREYRGIPLMPTLHPAFILRKYTPENRRMVWEDLKKALARMRGEG